MTTNTIGDILKGNEGIIKDIWYNFDKKYFELLDISLSDPISKALEKLQSSAERLIKIRDKISKLSVGFFSVPGGRPSDSVPLEKGTLHKVLENSEYNLLVKLCDVTNHSTIRNFKQPHNGYDKMQEAISKVKYCKSAINHALDK